MYKQLFALHAEILKALAHPRRLEIIHLLRDHELSVTEIHSMLDLPQANVSQHLMILRDTGIVINRREGKQLYYRLSDRKIIKASDLLREVLIERNPDSALAAGLTLDMSELVPLVHDPVCQMRLSPKTAGFSTRYQGKQYYFCASGCVKKFENQPAKYV